MEKENLVQKARKSGAYFLESLQSLQSEKVREVRGLGLMLGIELKEKAGPYVQQLMEKGVIALLAGATVIRLLPPLIISKEQIDTVLGALRDVLC
jgi:acetylornithine/LysW-gamma-L-lysine aminotransferase